MLCRTGHPGHPRPPRPRRRRAPSAAVAASLAAACLLCAWTGPSVASAQDYLVPDPIIEAFHPKGFRVSIPDSDGIDLFAFHGNVNRPLNNVEAGEMSVDITHKTGGLWSYYNPQKRLKVGDVINYWLYVQRDGRGYQRLEQTHRIAALIPTAGDSSTTPVRSPEDRPNQGSNDFEYRPPPPSYESRPPHESRPPPRQDGHRPPPRQDGHRPPPDEGHRPPPDEGHRPPPYDSRPPPYDSRPPPYDSRPPPYDSRPPPPPEGGHRPSSGYYGSRPPPPPDNNYAYPPPPPPSQPASTGVVVSHNHHVGYPTTTTNSNNYNSGDRYEHNHSNTGDRYPRPPPPSQPASTGVVVSHNHHVGYPTTPTNSNNYNNGDRYPTTANNNNYNSGDRYPPTNNNNYNGGDRYPTSNPQQEPYNPVPAVARPTGGVGTTDVDFNPTLGAFSPSQATWGQGQGQGQQGLGLGSGPGLPLNGDRFTAPPPSSSDPNCELSATYVNGRPACKGQVVFEEDFKTLNLGRWSHEVKISGGPDYEFCIYAPHPENTFVSKGHLHLHPTLTNDKYGADFVRKGKLELTDCTGGPVNSDSCSREAMFSYILPPVVASRINTKNSFSFKYGRIDVRARLPRGDWIYPEVWLQPLREEYGPGLASGRVVLAMARGNRQLRGPAPESDDISGKTLAVGALAGGKNVGSAAARRKFFTRRSEVGLWTEQFRNYTLLWTPDNLAFSVDGVEIGVARPEELGGLLHGRADEEVDPWAQGSRIAPFDKEFYISLGLAVGGVHAFPDGCRSGNHEKPWKNTAAKAMLSFWNARDVWHSTWNGQSDMLVESVRVTALNN